MRIRQHKGFGHGLRPGTDQDINCSSCKRERAEGVEPVIVEAGSVLDTQVSDDYEQVMDAIEAELYTFQWAYPDRGNNRGEIHVDREKRRLRLQVWVADNDDPDDDTPKPLDVSLDIALGESARQQIRGLIHAYLTHEADEQMWFGNERPFYPHADHPQAA